MLIDTHAHLNFDVYKDDFDEVIRRSLDNGIWMTNVGTNFETSKRAVKISQKYPTGVYAAIGLHPINLDTGLVRIKIDPAEFSKKTHGASETEDAHFEKEFDFEKYKKLALRSFSEGKVVAIGEIGLDYYWKPKTTKKKQLFKQRQKDLLSEELELAKTLNLPVIFHCRMAHSDLIEFLSENPKLMPKRAVAHGFVGNLEQLQEYLNFGFYIGFNGIIFKKIEGIDFEENIKKTPLEKILIETDCPYLTPPPFENERNEPLYLRYIVQKIAKIKKIISERIAEITTKNARELFKT